MTDIASTKENVKVTYVISDIYNNLESKKEDDKYKENIKIKVKAYIDEAEKEIDLDESFEDIKSAIKERIQDLIDKAINKSMYQYKSDVLSFFKKFSEKFPNGVNSKEEFIDKFIYDLNLEVDLKLTKWLKSDQNKESKVFGLLVNNIILYFFKNQLYTMKWNFFPV